MHPETPVSCHSQVLTRIFALIPPMQSVNASPTPLVQTLMGPMVLIRRTWPTFLTLISSPSNSFPTRTNSDRTRPLTLPTSRMLSRMVLIGSTFMPKQQLRESSDNTSLLDLTQPLVLVNLLPSRRLACLPTNHTTPSRPSMPPRVSARRSVCRRNETDWCSANNLTVSTTQDEQVKAYDTWYHAANSAGVNIIHYQWGQENLTASPAGPIRPQASTTSAVANENTVGVSPDDGYAT